MKFKKGAASIYMVLVCTILFSVITVGFIALTVNEMSKSSEFSLSESALHSAEAGVEDVKRALAECAKSTSDKTKCEDLLIKKNDCGQMKNLNSIIGTPVPSDTESDEAVQEVKIGETETATQAYTCIVIDPYTSDYLGSLSAENSVKIIPLQVHDTGSGVKNGDVEYVEISWYSSENLGSDSANYGNKGNFSDIISIPPTISASIYQIISGNVKRGGFWLIPQENAESSSNNISKDKFEDSSKYISNLTEANVYDEFRYEKITCNNTAPNGYLCSVQIEIEKDENRSNERGSLLLVLGLPYQNPRTDFKVQMFDSSKNVLQFDKVQIAVDSTGRANDVYSRIETRLENETTFPIPDYAMTLLGEGTVLEKTFYVGKR